MRRGTGSIVANPVLVGAVTVLVIVVAVFLAYNANNGLPFVPTKTLLAEVDNGAEVVPGVEVREGGYRIGVVVDTVPRQLSNGKVGGLLELKLDESAGPFPSDSRIVVRPRSPLALKIVQFERGRSSRALGDGQRIAVDQSEIRTDLDELYTLYDEPTRRGVQENLTGFGGAFVGRGRDLHTTIRALPALLDVVTPVMANLSDPSTDLPTFFDELADFTRVIAPVSERFAGSFASQADTFEAISRDPEALKATISKGPPTLQASTRSMRVQRPFLRDTTLLSRELNLASRDLKAALPPVNRALEIGTPVTRRTITLQDELRTTFASLQDLTSTPTTNGALRALTATVTSIQPQLRFLGPYITGCNYWNIFWTFTAEHFTAPDPTGSAQRVLLNTGDRQDDNVSNSMGANEYATGRRVLVPRGVKQYVHTNTSGGNAMQRDQIDCTPGQQGYAYAANKHGSDAPGNTGFYQRAVVDQLNGLIADAPKGPTFKKFDKNGRGYGRNPAVLPEGQTYTDIPGGRGALTEHDRDVLRARGQERP